MKIEERKIILSCDSCSCRAKEAAYRGFIRFKNRKIGKKKIEERKIILSRDCSCRATERIERQPIGDSFDLKIGK